MDRIESDADEAACLQRIETDAATARSAARKLEQLRDGLGHAVLSVVPAAPSTTVAVDVGATAGLNSGSRSQQLPRAILALEHLYGHEVREAADALASASRSLAIARQEVRDRARCLRKPPRA